MTKAQISSKSQYSIFKQGKTGGLEFEISVIGIYLIFGFWLLGFLCRFKVYRQATSSFTSLTAPGASAL